MPCSVISTAAVADFSLLNCTSILTRWFPFSSFVTAPCHCGAAIVERIPRLLADSLFALELSDPVAQRDNPFVPGGFGLVECFETIRKPRCLVTGSYLCTTHEAKCLRDAREFRLHGLERFEGSAFCVARSVKSQS